MIIKGIVCDISDKSKATVRCGACTECGMCSGRGKCCCGQAVTAVNRIGAEVGDPVLVRTSIPIAAVISKILLVLPFMLLVLLNILYCRQTTQNGIFICSLFAFSIGTLICIKLQRLIQKKFSTSFSIIKNLSSGKIKTEK